MHQGQTVAIIGTNSFVLLSPWMRSGGDHAVFTYEIVAESNSPTFEVEVYTKAQEDRASEEGTRIVEVGDWANYGGTAFYTVDVKPNDAINELFRFKITVTSSEGGSSVIYRFLEPTWYNKGGTNS